jgi:hypothetical protein
MGRAMIGQPDGNGSKQPPQFDYAIITSRLTSSKKLHHPPYILITGSFTFEYTKIKSKSYNPDMI